MREERTFERGEKVVTTRTPSAATQLLAEGWVEVFTNTERPVPEVDAPESVLPDDEVNHRRSEPAPGSPPAPASRSRSRNLSNVEGGSTTTNTTTPTE